MTNKQEVSEYKGEPPAITVTEQPVSADVAFIQMIERVSRSADVRMDIVQGLVAMRNDELKRVAEQAFNAALAEAQAQMEPVRRDASNPQTRSKYATYDALDRAIRPIYTAHGFSVRFDTADAPRDLEVRVVAKIAHRGGHTEITHIDIPSDGKGAKGNDVMTRTHAVVSATSYGRRVLLGMGFNLATTDKADDDGNGASATGELISPEDEKALQSLLMEHDIPLPKFFKVMKVERLSELSARDVAEAHRQISEVIAARAAKRRESVPA